MRDEHLKSLVSDEMEMMLQGREKMGWYVTSLTIRGWLSLIEGVGLWKGDEECLKEVEKFVANPGAHRARVYGSMGWFAVGVRWWLFYVNRAMGVGASDYNDTDCQGKVRDGVYEE
jgi:hypothetical protein